MKKKILIIIGLLIFIIVIGIVGVQLFLGPEGSVVDDNPEVKQPEIISDYNDLKKIIEDNGYIINYEKGSIRDIINLNSNRNNYSFYIADEETMVYVAFGEKLDGDYLLAYQVSTDTLLGLLRDKTCIYAFRDNGEEVNKITNDTICSDDDIKELQDLHIKYESTIKDTFKTNHEKLYEFIIKYNKQAKEES